MIFDDVVEAGGRLTLKLADYQRQAATTMIYKEKVLYPALGLGNEAGEVQGKLKKVLRDGEGLGRITDEQRAGVLDECGDVLWYLTAVLTDLRGTFTDLVPYTQETFAEFQYYTDGEGLSRERLGAIGHAVDLLREASWVQNTIVDALVENDNDIESLSTYTRRDVFAHLEAALSHLSALVTELGGELESVAQSNLDKLLSRQKRGTLHGSGDKR